jgi:ABC-type Fe3+-citrate transport system substrate-binding protein
MSDAFAVQAADALQLDDNEFFRRGPFGELVLEIGAADAHEAYQAFVDDTLERLARLQPQLCLLPTYSTNASFRWLPTCATNPPMISAW